MMKKIYFLGILLLTSFAYSQTVHTVKPNTIDSLSGTPNNNHLAYINQAITSKNKLFLFLPGTYAIPFNYREILKHAANLGYHSIGLTYPNNLLINSICATSIDTTCHSRARLEVFDGIDRHDDIDVDTNNCIKQRTLKLLQYLQNNYPTENWGQYLTNNQINWDKIIVSGHSQGGGHAGIIAKIKKVDRVVMFSTMDWVPTLNRNADWVSWNSLTSPEKYYGFVHTNDELFDFTNIQTTWNRFKMNGSLVNVDTSNSPYQNSQILCTIKSPSNNSDKFHNSVVVDVDTPLELNKPIFSSVWTYMIEGNNTLVSTINNSDSKKVKVYPNPTSSVLNIISLGDNNYEYVIYNLQGEKVIYGTIEKNRIDLSNLSKGIYLLKLQNKYTSNSIRVIKK